MVAVGSRIGSLYTIVDFLVVFSGGFLNDFDDLFDASVWERPSKSCRNIFTSSVAT